MKDLLQEFINMNISALYSLDRFVTINALKDVVGGPDPINDSLEQSTFNDVEHVDAE